MWADEGSFEMAVKAYEQGNDKLAEVYFMHLLEDEPLGRHIPEATYYLIKIYDKREDFLNFFSYASYFLDSYVYDQHRKDVFDLLLQKLIEKEAFGIALEYIDEYGYLLDDNAILESIGHGLFRQGRKDLAEHVFSLCPQTDTIKILRAAVTDDFSKKREYYEGIPGINGKVRLMELLLEKGDTIEVYDIFRSIDHRKVDDGVLYPYTKISRLFDGKKFSYSVERLYDLKKCKTKALLLEGIHTGHLDTIIQPRDEEEYALFVQFLKRDTISRNPPDIVYQDILLSDSLTLEDIISLRKEIGRNYYLDSVYCASLLENNKIDEAYRITMQYLDYLNTKRYARKIRALKYFNGKDYVHAANDIILSQADEPELLFILAQALSEIGKESAYLYREVIEISRDTLLVTEAMRQLIKLDFGDGRYEAVVKYPFDVVQGDTNLVKLYVYSLARMGKRVEAGALFDRYFTYQDHNLANYYGEYLIDRKKYIEAEGYYNNLVHSAEGYLPNIVYYNWALIPFLRGEIDTALNRFALFVNSRKTGREFYTAAFKIATIHYLKSQFDKASYYYGLASEDDSLRYDALSNQLICYKKSADWEKAIEVGKRMLSAVSEAEKPDIQFDIGYAYLRSGAARTAIDHLKSAADAESSPEFYYWLAEAYLATGDFMRALYQYQKVVHLFPGDEMWTPTALYKTGVVFEFMNEMDEAVRIYEQLIRERGIGDTWGIEAQKRLKEIE